MSCEFQGGVIHPTWRIIPFRKYLSTNHRCCKSPKDRVLGPFSMAYKMGVILTTKWGPILQLTSHSPVLHLSAGGFNTAIQAFPSSVRSISVKFPPQMGVSLNGGTPISHPKCWSILVGKPMVVGETHRFRKPPNEPSKTWGFHKIFLENESMKGLVWGPVVWDSNRVPVRNNPFHKEILRIQTTGPQTTN